MGYLKAEIIIIIVIIIIAVTVLRRNQGNQKVDHKVELIAGQPVVQAAGQARLLFSG